MRDELLNETLFMSMGHAREKITAWPMITTPDDHTPRSDMPPRRRSPLN